MDIDELVKNNMGLVYKQLHRFNLAYDNDAISFAMEGLWNAAKTFDGMSTFSTYACVCIYNAIGMYVRSKNRKRQLTIVSYDDFIEGSDEHTMSEFIADEEVLEEAFMRRELYNATVQTIERLLSSMKSSSKKDIIQLWYDSQCTMQQEELADATGTSQSYVSRVLCEFKHKIKTELEDFL